MAMSSEKLQRQDRIHTFATIVLKILGQHSHGEEIGKAEVIAFRACVKRHALVSNDNPHRIIAEVSRMLSNFAKTLLPCEKSLIRFARGLDLLQRIPKTFLISTSIKTSRH